MINIDKFKTFVYSVANKSGRGTITPAQFNSFTEQALMAWYNQQLGARDANGVPISLKSYNQDYLENLLDIREERDLYSNMGDVLIPDGTTYDLNGNLCPEYWNFGAIGFKYFKTINGEKIVQETPIEIVKDNEWYSRTSSSIVPPSLRRPIAKFGSTKITVRPKSVGSITLIYLKIPSTPKWGYITVNSRPVYDSASSVDIEAPKEAFNQIAMITLGFLGIHLREQELVQMGNMNEQKGI